MLSELKNKKYNFVDIDYPIGDFLEYNLDDEIMLDDTQALQRDYVWNLVQKQEFILSIIYGRFIPNFVSIITYIGTKKIVKIIDGKQRLSAIKGFVNDEFKITINDVDYLFSELTHTDKIYFLSQDIVVSRIVDYNNTLTINDYIDIFLLFNYSGTVMEKEYFENLKKFKNNLK